MTDIWCLSVSAGGGGFKCSPGGGGGGKYRAGGGGEGQGSGECRRRVAGAGCSRVCSFISHTNGANQLRICESSRQLSQEQPARMVRGRVEGGRVKGGQGPRQGSERGAAGSKPSL